MRRLRGHVGAALLTVAVLLASWGGVGPGVAAECTRDDFFATVDTAGAELRKLSSQNKPTFQAKLLALKQKRGWDHSTFLKHAAPLVQDEKIAAFDANARQLLARLTRMGEEGGEQAKPDCNLLEELRRIMRELVAVQNAKWAYMFDRIDGELAK